MPREGFAEERNESKVLGGRLPERRRTLRQEEAEAGSRPTLEPAVISDLGGRECEHSFV